MRENTTNVHWDTIKNIVENVKLTDPSGYDLVKFMEDLNYWMRFKTQKECPMIENYIIKEQDISVSPNSK